MLSSPGDRDDGAPTPSAEAEVRLTSDYDSHAWRRVQTAHGFSADEVISALQKFIRRGHLEDAALIAYEMYATSAELEEYLWRRLEVISIEDIGFGNVQLPAVIDALYAMHHRVPRNDPSRFLFAAHAVRLLAMSPKDRTSDELAWWIAAVVDAGERLPEIPDFALDVHTKRGVELGRGDKHFVLEGALLVNEIPERDLTYRKRLLDMLERAEA
jgi:replication-associated recombination protein RarA